VVFEVVFSVLNIEFVTGIVSDDMSDDSMSEQCVIGFFMSNEAEDELCCVGINPPETLLYFEDISTLLIDVLIHFHIDLPLANHNSHTEFAANILV